jgi:predicted metal-dependent phosphoesterase TrpH
MFHPDVLKRVVDEEGGVMILAHPYRRRLYGDQEIEAAVEKHHQAEIFDMVDAIEVLNGKASPKQTCFSRTLLRKLNQRGVGGSDAHLAADIGSSATYFERTIKDLSDLIGEIKAGRFAPVDLRTCRGPFIKQAVAQKKPS